MWAGVTARFFTFHQNLRLTDSQIVEGLAHHSGVRRSLNSHYYGLSSNTANSFLIGSWGKCTKTRPPRDIDLYFVLPYDVYRRFESVQGNKQSALLQEVRRVLSVTYPNTRLRGDGQVVVVEFNRMSVEVVPAFLLVNGKYWICDTHDGGQYKIADPKTEGEYVAIVDRTYSGNLRALIMMMKAWQDHCNVKLKSFCVELIASKFMLQCPWRWQSYFYYDWIMRDFFAYLYRQANQCVVVPGTNEVIRLGDEWQSRTATAYNRAAMACEFEKYDLIDLAGAEWQKIFGHQISRTIGLTSLPAR